MSDPKSETGLRPRERGQRRREVPNAKTLKWFVSEAYPEGLVSEGAAAQRMSVQVFGAATGAGPSEMGL